MVHRSQRPGGRSSASPSTGTEGLATPEQYRAAPGQSQGQGEDPGKQRGWGQMQMHGL